MLMNGQEHNANGVIEAIPGGPLRNSCAREKQTKWERDDKPAKKDEGLMLINAQYCQLVNGFLC